MQGKNIKKHLHNKIYDWANNVEDEEIKNLILTKTIVTGGSIVSLLQDEEPKDYDVYFTDIESLEKVAQYYINKFIDNAIKSKDDNKTENIEETLKSKLVVEKCFWDNSRYNENKQYWHVIKEDTKVPENAEIRLRIFIKSTGAISEEFSNDIEFTNYIDDYKEEFAKLNDSLKEKKLKNKYRPTFFTNNAITLSDKIQIVLRFYGNAEKLHESYDFVHTLSYYETKNNNLEMPARTLEAIINKELYYIGSKYPLCSIIRARKFIKRGWSINAGQFVKMALQLNEMNLKNLHVFEEQLIGVDSSYFNNVISLIKDKEKLPEELDTQYLIDLINTVFDTMEEDHCED